MAAISNTSLAGSSNLKYYVKLDGNVTDSGQHAISATATDISYTTGKYGSAAALNGITSKITLSNDANLNFGTGDFSVSFWVCPTDVSQGDQDWIGRQAGAGAYFLVRVKDEGAGVLIQLYTDAGNNFNFIDTSVTFSNGVWYHIVAVLDRTNSKVKYYRNGVFINEGSVTGNPSMGTTNAWLLGESAFSTIYCEGYLDDVGIFNKALSATEVAYLFNESSYLDLTSKVW